MPSFTVWEHVGYTVEAENGQAALETFLKAEAGDYLGHTFARDVTDEHGDDIPVNHNP